MKDPIFRENRKVYIFFYNYVFPSFYINIGFISPADFVAAVIKCVSVTECRSLRVNTFFKIKKNKKI